MSNFLASNEFKLFWFPLITIFLNVIVKANSYNSRHSRITKEDFAVGLEIALTAVVSLVIFAATLAQQLNPLPASQSNAILVSFICFGGLIAVSGLVREKGWRAKYELNSFGLILPYAYGVLTLHIAAQVMGV